MERQKIYGNSQEFIHLNSFIKNVKPELSEFLILPTKMSQENWALISLTYEEINYIVQYSNDIVLLGLMAKNLKIKPEMLDNG